MTEHDPEKRHSYRQGRRSIRLKGYDYSRPGAYFVTICTWKHKPVLGRVVEGEMILSEFGTMVQQVWEGLPAHYPHVELDAWVIMPNHVHGVIMLTDTSVDSVVVGAGLRPAPTGPAPTGPAPTKRHGLPEIVRALKSFSARRINQRRDSPGTPVWQRNYFEHVVRSERALNAIREYIHQNPLRWQLDRYNPSAVGPDLQAKALWSLLRDDSIPLQDCHPHESLI